MPLSSGLHSYHWEKQLRVLWGFICMFKKSSFKLMCGLHDLCYACSPNPEAPEDVSVRGSWFPEEDTPTFDAGSHRGHVDNVARFLSQHLPKQNKDRKAPQNMLFCRLKILPLPKMYIWCFPGDSLVKNPPANARGMDSISDWGRPHVQWSSYTHARPLLSKSLPCPAGEKPLQ